MNFQDLKFNEDSPIYLQVVRYFKRKILIGELQNGDELPSRRIMATTMGLNLTTIQKIYILLFVQALSMRRTEFILL